ncbi:hypothetical protein J6590_049186 [Homalodisca vitripennis]|nr:hypothetical protein J6590_049186 [Homalodisca vitripennis]
MFRGLYSLDSVVTSLNSWEYCVTIGDPVIADHSPVIIVDLKLDAMNNSAQSLWYNTYLRTSRTVNDANLYLLKMALQEVNWTHVICRKHGEDAFNAFFFCLTAIFDRICPVNLAKKLANMLKIENAHNRCKAAWDLVNQIYKCKPAMKCTASPDEVPAQISWGRSTVIAVSHVSSRILNAFEERDSTALILADLSKAFDCVSHEMLL